MADARDIGSDVRHVAPADGTLAEAESAARRFAFLADVGQALSSSLDYEQTLRDVARLAVPTLADFCIVDVLEDGIIRRVAVAHASAEKALLLERLRARHPVTMDSPQPAARVLRSGEPELLTHVDSKVIAAHTRDADHADLIRAIDIRSHIAVPLVARGATVGVISLAITESARRYRPEDVAFAFELARRAALAVDNARLYQDAQKEVAERRRTEEALRLSEARFRAVIEQSPLSTQIFAKDGTTIKVNRSWEELWGITLDQIPGYNVLEDPQLESRGIALLLRRAFAGEAVELPAIRYDPNETVPHATRHADPVRWVRAFAYPIKDDQDAVREVVLVHEDVTNRFKAESELRASEDRLKLALAAGRMNVWHWDLQADRVQCSENARELWGIAIGNSADFIRVIHPDDQQKVLLEGERALSAVGETGYGAEYRLRTSDGQVHWVQSRGRVDRDADGRALRIVGVTADISDRKAAEEANRVLADAGESLGGSLDYHVTLQNLGRAVVPGIADWCAVDLVTETGELERVTVHHPDPKLVALANHLFVRYPPRRSGGGVYHVIATAQPEWAPDIGDDVLQAAAHDDEHLRILRALDLRSYIAVPLVARGAAIGVLTLVYAESGRRYRAEDVELAKEIARRAAAAVDNARLYQRLRDEDRRKDEFLATLAHELRNPLAPMRTGLEILRRAGAGESTARTREIMERQLGHMVRLIDDLLDVSRVTRGKVALQHERLELAVIIATAIDASRPALDAAGVEIHLDVPDEPVLFQGDRTRLAQVLSNLLNNAAKYTERGGRVDVFARREGGELVIVVKDNGIGIPREMLTHVFEMFAQVGRSLERSQGGLGIGLTLVKRLVELHGGRVWAESDGPGRGSTFSVRLPIVTPPPEVAELSDDGPRVSPTARRVLVVDDNADAADSLATMLGLGGHEVRMASSGPAALDVLRDFRPDVAFLDIGLPGMNGYELARRLRGEPHLASMILVAVTGWGQAEDRRMSKDAGFDHHLTKPADPRDVDALVK